MAIEVASKRRRPASISMIARHAWNRPPPMKTSSCSGRCLGGWCVGFCLVRIPTQERFWVQRFAYAEIPKEFEPMPAQAYRRHAADCLKISLVVSDPEARLLLKQMAFAWASLADRAENSRQTPQSAQHSRPSMGLDFDKLTPDEQRRVLDG
jgi:hypothetical protein